MHANHVRSQITADNVLRELEQSTSDRQKSFLPRCISPRTPPSRTLAVLVFILLLVEPKSLGESVKGRGCIYCKSLACDCNEKVQPLPLQTWAFKECEDILR
jgi:hypothetical protein